MPQLVSITGSTRAGMEVAAAAAPDLKRTHLELGGKAPVVVFDDADVAAAAEAIAVGGYFNAGQDCTAATRVLAGPGIHDDFVAALTEQARGTKTGAPDDEDVLYGPLNNANQLARVTGFVDRLPDHADAARSAATRVGDRGYFYAPTVVSGLRQQDEIIQDEVFGPVITVQRFTDEDEAVRWANGVEYGLSASVWTSDHGRAMRMTRRLDFGCVWVNTHIPLVVGDAARRVQALRPRQGPVDVRPGGLHPRQARHAQHRSCVMASSEELHKRRTAAVARGVSSRHLVLCGPRVPAATLTDVDGREWIDFAVRHRGHQRRQRRAAGRRGGAGAGRAVHPHLLHGRAVRVVRGGLRDAQRADPGRLREARRRCSTPAPRRWRTR